MTTTEGSVMDMREAFEQTCREKNAYSALTERDWFERGCKATLSHIGDGSKAEPVIYQRRQRPLFGAESQRYWTEWENCTKGNFEDIQRTPVLHDWEHQARELFARAPTAQDSLPNEQGSNRYGLDMAYFRNLINRELNHSRGLHDYKPSELARVFARMAAAADRAVLQEPEFHPAQDSKVPEGYVLAKKADVESAINMMRYACHPHKSPHADDLEAGLLSAAPVPVPDKPQSNPHDQIQFVGYTNGAQILYANDDGEGTFYKDTDNNCVIPLYMLKTHWHRLESTTNGEVTMDRIKGLQRPAAPEGE